MEFGQVYRIYICKRWPPRPTAWRRCDNPVRVAFVPEDLETAELLSRMVGPTTVHLAKRSLAGAPLVLGPRRHTLSREEVARPLLTEEEVRRLPDGEALVFVAGHAVIRGRRAALYEDAEMRGKVRVRGDAR